MTLPRDGTFHAGQPSHLVVLGLTVLLAVVLVLGGRAGRPWTRTAEVWLGWAIFLSFFGEVGSQLLLGEPVGWGHGLPMHMCNWAGFAAWAGLVLRNRTAAELAWFWGMSGTLQATLTPNQTIDFPHPTFVTFFVLHSGVVIAACYFVFGKKWKPRAGGWWRAIAWTQGYVVVAALVDLTTGANYAFLRAKPVNASLMDKLGPWPWYVLGLHAVGYSAMILLDMPFWRGRRRGETRMEDR